MLMICAAFWTPLQALAQGSPIQSMPVTPPPGAAKLPRGTPLTILKPTRFHTEPHHGSDIIQIIPAGSTVALDGAWGATWVQIRYRGQRGYVFRSLTRPVQ